MRISIVTPCLNRRDMIAGAIESVLAQQDPDVEHIVIDGGSTDGTLDVLAGYPHLVVVSEPDRNLYDALNKGIRLASGDIVGHLNSDDIYAPGTFAAVRQAFANHPEAEAVCGNAHVSEGETVMLDCSDDFCRELTPRNALLGLPIINARFFLRRAYDRIGLYSLDYPLVSDRDFLLRAALGGIRSIGIDTLFMVYQMHPGSATFTNSLRSRVRLNQDSVALATTWLETLGSEQSEARHFSRQLLGKSVLHLAMLHARQGQPAQALAALFRLRGHWSTAPLAAALSAVVQRARGLNLSRPRAAPTHGTSTRTNG